LIMQNLRRTQSGYELWRPYTRPVIPSATVIVRRQLGERIQTLEIYSMLPMIHKSDPTLNGQLQPSRSWQWSVHQLSNWKSQYNNDDDNQGSRNTLAY